jgi:hypothetical protein
MGYRTATKRLRWYFEKTRKNRVMFYRLEKTGFTDGQEKAGGLKRANRTGLSKTDNRGSFFWMD